MADQLTEEQVVLKRVIQTSLHRGLLAKGVHEVCKSLENKQAKFVILAEDCNDDNYKKLVIGLAKKQNVPVWKLDKGALLGEWIGICKFLNKAQKLKSRKCSSVVVKDYAIEVSEGEKNLIEDRLKGL